MLLRASRGLQRRALIHLPRLAGGSLTNPSYLFHTAFDVSRASDIGISAYLRNSSIKPYAASRGHERKDSQSGRDVFLGSAVLQPVFDPRRQSDTWYS